MLYVQCKICGFVFERPNDQNMTECSCAQCGALVKLPQYIESLEEEPTKNSGNVSLIIGGFLGLIALAAGLFFFFPFSEKPIDSENSSDSITSNTDLTHSESDRLDTGSARNTPDSHDSPSIEMAEAKQTSANAKQPSIQSHRPLQNPKPIDLSKYIARDDILKASLTDDFQYIYQGKMRSQRGSHLVLIPLSKPVEYSRISATLPIILKDINGVSYNLSYYGIETAVKLNHPEGFENIIFKRVSSIAARGNSDKVNVLAFSIPRIETQTAVLQAPLQKSPVNRPVAWQPIEKIAADTKNYSSNRSGSRKSSSSSKSTVHTAATIDPSWKKVEFPFSSSLENIGVGGKDELIFYDSVKRVVLIYQQSKNAFLPHITIAGFGPVFANNDYELAIFTENEFIFYSLETGLETRRFGYEGKEQIFDIIMGARNKQMCWLLTADVNNQERYGLLYQMRLEDGKLHKEPRRLTRLNSWYPQRYPATTFADPNLTYAVTHSDRGNVFLGHNEKGVWNEKSIRDLALPTEHHTMIETSGDLHDAKSQELLVEKQRNEYRFYLPIRGTEYLMTVSTARANSRAPREFGEMLVVHPKTRRELFSLGKSPPTGDKSYYDKQRAKFYHYNGDTGVLYVINYKDKFFHTRKIPFWENVKKAGNYLTVKDLNIEPAIRNHVWRHQLNVKSNEKDVNYKIVSAPEGMTLEKGLLEWKVPDKQMPPPPVQLELTTASNHVHVQIPVMIHRKDEIFPTPVIALENMREGQMVLPISDYAYECWTAMDGKYLVIRTKTNSCIGVDLVNRKVLSHFNIPQYSKIAVGGTHLCVFSSRDNTFSVYDYTTGKRVKQFRSPLKGQPSAIVMGSNSGDRVACMYRNAIQFLRLPQGTAVTSIPTIRPDRRSYYWTGSTAYANPELTEFITTAMTHLRKYKSVYLVNEKRFSVNYKHTPFLTDSEIVYGSQTYQKKDLTLLHSYEVVDNGVHKPELKPIQGSSMYAGYHENGVYIYSRGKKRPIEKWSEIPKGYEYRIEQPGRITDRFGISAKWNVGYVIPVESRSVVIGPYGSSSDTKVQEPSGPARYEVRAGSPWEHQLVVDTSYASPKYQLLLAPKGLSINDKGEMAWDIPASLDHPVRVNVKITSSTKSKIESLILVPTKKTSGSATPNDKFDQTSLQLAAGKIRRTELTGLITAASKKHKTKALIEKLVKPCVGAIKTSEGESPIIFISSRGHFLVNANAAPKNAAATITYVTSTGKKQVAESYSEIARDTSSRLCLMKIDTKLPIRRLVIAEQSDVKKDEAAWVAGATGQISSGLVLTINDNIISMSFSSANIEVGNPVLDTKGNLLGMIYHADKASGRADAINYEVIRSFLEMCVK